jgi:glycosyltransferase involved in cell wall biosynthesis
MRALVRENRRAGEPDEFTHWYRLSRRWKRGHEPPVIEGARRRWFQEPLWPLSPGADVVHGLDCRVPAWRGVARVATVHDLFALLPGTFTDERTRERKAAQYREAAERCDRILAVSEVTRRDFLEHLDYPADRVDVVHEGVGEEFGPQDEGAVARARTAHGLERPYLFYVGDLTARKNLVRLVRAWGRSPASADLDLALAGARAWGASELDGLLGDPALSARVHLLDFVPDAELPLLYAGAEAFLFPSLYEGFGLPVLEAMACGTPVLASTTGSLPEVAGEHAVLVDPADEAAIAEGIDRVLGLGPDAVARAAEHAAGFTWEACARGTRAVHERAVSGPRRD